MLPRYFIVAASCALLLGEPLPATANNNWSKYIIDFGISEASLTNDIGGFIDQTNLANAANQAANFSNTGVMAVKVQPAMTVPYLSGVLDAADFGNGVLGRMSSGVPLEQALEQETIVSGSSIAINSVLNTALTSCFASGACAISAAGGLVTLGTTAAILGTAFDVYKVGAIANALINIHNNSQQLAASLEQVQRLQQQVNLQNSLKQESQARNARAPSQPLQSTNTTAQDTIVTIRPGRTQTNSPATVTTQIQNTPFAGTGRSAANATLTEIGVGPASKINTFGGPVLIGEPAEIGGLLGKPVQVATPVNIGTAVGVGQTNGNNGANTALAPGAPSAAGYVSPSLSQINAQPSAPAQESMPTAANSPPSTKATPAVTQIIPGNGPENVIITIVPGKGTASATSATVQPSNAANTSSPYIYVQSAIATTNTQRTTEQSAQQGVLTTNQLQTLKSYADSIKPPPVPPPPSYTTPSSALVVAPPSPRPGGISLSLAAAMRMRLDFDFDGMAFKDGEIVLTGNRATSNYIDAALFLTALRTACEPGDPYFSLDPDHGPAWLEEGGKLTDTLDVLIRHDLHLWEHFDKSLPNGLTFRVVSARRAYPDAWAQNAPNYPDFQTRLVFRPEWLRQTRFGEILYRADVLLKELASGTALLNWNRSAAAEAIDQYVSADARRAAKLLLSRIAGGVPYSPPVHGERLWFDFSPEAAPPPSSQSQVYIPDQMNAAAAGLYKTLLRRGFLATPTKSERSTIIASDDGALDLSQVYPKMFVRVTDIATHSDLEESNLDFEQLAHDVNQRISLYENSYPELRALIAAFRAYLVAVNVLETHSAACNQIKSIPLLPSETLAEPLPLYRPSEVIFTYGTYSFRSDRVERQEPIIVSSIQGGVSLSGKRFYAAAIQRDTPTAITRTLGIATPQSGAVPIWSETSGRQFIALRVDSGELLAAAGPLDTAQVSSPEAVLRKQQMLTTNFEMEKERRGSERAQREYQTQLQQWQRLKSTLEDQERRWHDAEATWEGETRRAAAHEAERDLATTYGPPIDRQTAELALHYLGAAKAASPLIFAESTPPEGHSVVRWETVFANAGYSERQIHLIGSSGFFASIEEDIRTGEMIIGYGTQATTAGLSGLDRLAQFDAQREAAIKLAVLVKRNWSYGPVTFTGYGAGGELAAFVARQLGTANAVTFQLPHQWFAENGASTRIDIGWVDGSR